MISALFRLTSNDILEFVDLGLPGRRGLGNLINRPNTSNQGRLDVQSRMELDLKSVVQEIERLAEPRANQIHVCGRPFLDCWLRLS